MVGTGSSWMLCPFEGEVWGVSSVLGDPNMRDRHYDKVFAFDNLSKHKNSFCVEKLNEYIAIATEKNIPIVSTQGYATERYPLLKMFDEFKVLWFRSTISYMLALSIYQGYEIVHIYGIDQDKEQRYIQSRPFVDFWLGVMVGRGVHFTIANKNFPQYMPSEMEMILKKTKSSELPEWNQVKEKGELNGKD